MTCGVYKITSPSGNFYIGSSKNIEGRWRQHIKGYGASRIRCPGLKLAFDKYPVLCFSILLVCREPDLLFYEQLLIDNLRPKYNRSSIAGKIEMTEAVRDKIRLANATRVVSDETRMKMSASRTGNRNAAGSQKSEAGMEAFKLKRRGQKPALGMRHTPEFKAKMSTFHKQRWARIKGTQV